MKNIKKILINAIMKIINRIGQEQIIDNINKELYIKEYEKDDFTAEYSYYDVFTSNKRYFLDLEFAHKKNRIVSDIASIGCVLKIDNEIIDSFHMIYNKNSDELTKNLKDSILNGVKTTESKEDMFIKFKQFLNKNGNHPIIVWGDDGQLLNKEYCNNENPFDGICSYYFEVAAVKMICEVTSSDTVLKAFTLNNMDYIIEEMTNYGITKEEASKALEIMESILDSWHNKDKEYKYSIGEVNKNCIFKFQKCIDTKNNDKN